MTSKNTQQNTAIKVKQVADTDPQFAPGYIAALRETIEKRNAEISRLQAILADTHAVLAMDDMSDAEKLRAIRIGTRPLDPAE